MREIWVIKLNLPIFVTIQNRCGLWRNKNSDPAILYGFGRLLLLCWWRVHAFYSAWKICIFAGLDSFSADNGGKVIVCLYYYSDFFALAIRGMKASACFSFCKTITEIEKEYTKSGKLKSIVIRYRKEGMYHNFLVIKKDDVNIEGILNAILNYCPSVSVR